MTKLRAYFFNSFLRVTSVIRSSTLLMIMVLSSACSAPQQKLQNQAVLSGLKENTVIADKYLIKSYYSKNLEFETEETPNKLVFVYLEGDGRPWSKSLGPNNNPNTHRSVVLPLLIQAMEDTNEKGIYLSRPCYSLYPMPENCDVTLWTSHRYSKQVVDEMNEALAQLKKIFNIQKMVLVGHSGGGTLAMLLAKMRSDEKDIVAVVTLAGNLDHQAWTNYYGYLPLTGSLNPVDNPPLPSTVVRWHFAGTKDKSVPAELIKAAAEKDNGATIQVLDNVDHNCCWGAQWNKTVEDIKKAIELKNKE